MLDRAIYAEQPLPARGVEEYTRWEKREGEKKDTSIVSLFPSLSLSLSLSLFFSPSLLDGDNRASACFT